MFNSGFRGKRASDNTGTIASQSQFIQQKYPQPSITGYSIQGTDDTALNPAGGQTILVNGTGFATGLAVTVNGSTISPVTVISPTQISFTSTALAGGSYTLIVYNSTGGAAILVPGLIYSAVPTWTTAAGSIGTYYETTAINSNVVATSDSAITYSLVSGSLPSGATLYGNGVITGTSPVESGSSTYTFAIKAEDAELQDTTRTFTLTINTDVVTWSSPANNTTYTSNVNQVASNVVLSATSAAGYNVSYAANTLPTGLSLAGNTISGTPTVIANSSTLLTATAATTNRNATRTINWVIQLGSDAYFYLTTLLLNGETSSTYWVQDASTNGFNITINGDTRPVSTSPYNTAYSLLFNGSSNYLSVDANSAFSFGTGDFTVECFVKTGDNSLAPGGYSRSIMRVCQIDFYLRITQYHGGTDGALVVEGLSSGSTVTLKDDVWHHVALVRESSTVRLWIDGVYQTLGSGNTNTTNYSNSELNIFGGRSNPTGGFFNGYISNLRIVKGTAVYTGTSNFRVPTSPLTAIANTSILICNSNRPIDSSSNNLTVTAVSNPIVSNFTPLNETDLITGSGYFDGTGDYLTVPANAAFNFSTGDFTIECFYYRSGIKGNPYHDNIIGNRPSSLVSGQWHLYVGPAVAGAFSFTGRTPAGDITVTGGTCAENAWNHLAVVKNSTTLSLFVNGISVNSTTTSTSFGDSVSNLSIAAFNDGAYPTIGYISNARIVKGTAVYTSAFTPPTSPLTAIANTSLLTLQSRIGENNNRFIDTSGLNNLITRNGNTTQGTFSPFSQTGWSVYFDGVSDYFYQFNGGSINFPSSTEFTVECWIYKTARDASGYSVVIDGPENNQFAYDSTTEGSVSLVIAGSGIIGASGTAVQTNAWSHIAWVRQGTNTCRIYVNGVQQGTGTSTTGFNISIVGSYLGGGYEINGYVSNLRIVVGTCLYNNGTTFTPSTTPLTSVTNTKLLICQSNRFVDNSPSNYSFTVNGNLSIQAFSPFAPLITTPTSYSGYFDGTGDYLTVPNNSAFEFGSGDFTIEFWVFPTSHPSETLPISRTYDGSAYSFAPYFTSGAVKFLYNGLTQITSSSTLTLNTWTHIAYVRNSNTLTIYVNGTSTGSASLTGSITSSSRVTSVGAREDGNFPFVGYISNARIVKGTAVYTSAFTPTTSPLAAIANTSLLTCQSNRFIDNSTNNFTITVNGDSGPTQFNPFGNTSTTGSNASYSITTVGGSMYFDGTGDYLTAPSSSSFAFGTGNFTVEGWVYLTANQNFGPIFISSTTGTGDSLHVQINSANKVRVTNSDTQFLLATNAIPLNTWTHIAVTRSGTTLSIYQNGVLNGSTTNSTSFIQNGASVGYEMVGGNYYFIGYISNLRVSKGTAFYTSKFTPPTAPLTLIAGTSLLVNGTNSGIIDYTSKNILETVGDTKLSTSVKKFGSASMYFDGNGDNLTLNNSDLTKFGIGNFTIEFWAYFNNVSSRQATINNGWGDSGYDTLGGFTLDMAGTAGGTLALAVGTMNSGAFWIAGMGSFTTGVWYHIALVRNGTNISVYSNGNSIGSNTLTSSSTVVGNMPKTNIGSYSSNSFNFNGYIDDLRITKGIARYTTNFTAPTSAFITF